MRPLPLYKKRAWLDISRYGSSTLELATGLIHAALATDAHDGRAPPAAIGGFWWLSVVCKFRLCHHNARIHQVCRDREGSGGSLGGARVK